MDSLGKQIIAELYCCNRQRLDDVDFIRQAMINAAREAGTQIVTETFHRFSPQGVSGAVIITDSHLAIHTWPEHGYAAVDFFTCSETLYSEKAVDYLRDALESQQFSVEELRRGDGLA
jgi:S-adenosylmethionine decarboxylase